MAARGVLRRLGSVRVRTTLVATAVVGAALAVGAVGIVTLLHRSQISNVDAAVRLRARDVALLADSGNLPRVLPASADDSTLVQVVDPGGVVVTSSGNVEGEGPIASFPATPDGSPARTVGDLPVGGGGRYRIVAVAAGPHTVYAAGSLDAVEETTRRVARALTFGIPGLLVLVGGTTWFVAGRALRPVERMRAEVAEITERALYRRVPEPGTGDEVARLARTMNSMLDRIEAGADRQRRFVGDASHELRSPLASLKAQLEVALAHPQGADWRATGTDALAEVERMERLVDDLLTLARSDAGTLSPRSVPVDLDELVLEEAARVELRGRVRVDRSRVSGGRVVGDPDHLRRIVRNLLDNAERHAETTVTVELNGTDSAVRLVVADDGPGIAPADRERVFERFTRLDDARGRDAGGSGLGLSITRDLVLAHGGDIQVAPSPRGARFEVTLPSATGERTARSPLSPDDAERSRRPSVS